MYTPHRLFFTDAENGTATQHVWLRVPGYASDTYLGDVYETSDGGWVASPSAGPAQDRVKRAAVTGFMSKETAAAFLYQFAPPGLSEHYVNIYQPRDLWLHGTITVRGKDTRDIVDSLYAVIHQLDRAEMAGEESIETRSHSYRITTNF